MYTKEWYQQWFKREFGYAEAVPATVSVNDCTLSIIFKHGKA